jgi:sulfoxide reductase heme-binding subunit YedZ
VTADWYLMRGSGVVALLLLTTTFVLGVLATSRWRPQGRSRPVTRGLHRNVSLLAAVFLVIHVVSAIVHPDTEMGWVDAVLPFGAGLHPLATGLGTIALDLLLAILVTSALRPWIGRRAWRAVHWSAYALWPIAFLHTIAMASDLHTWWLGALAGGSFAAVAGATSWRVLEAS